jgi:hypothetical protein
MSALKLGMKILHEKNHINVPEFPQSFGALTAGKDRQFTLNY